MITLHPIRGTVECSGCKSTKDVDAIVVNPGTAITVHYRSVPLCARCQLALSAKLNARFINKMEKWFKEGGDV